MESEIKHCPRCDQTLPTGMFNKRKHHSGNIGLDGWCKICRGAYKKSYNRTQIVRRRLYAVEYNKGHPRRATPERSKKYYAKHREQRAAYGRAHRTQQNLRRVTRMKQDPNYRLKVLLRASMHKTLKGIEHSTHMLQLLGCSVGEFRKYLERQFKKGMTWDNWGQYGWHIDHIIPIARFDLTKEEKQHRCFHYTNLQPLWWYQNLEKSDKIIERQLILM
jgi:hypothetical protein